MEYGRRCLGDRALYETEDVLPGTLINPCLVAVEEGGEGSALDWLSEDGIVTRLRDLDELLRCQ